MVIIVIVHEDATGKGCITRVNDLEARIIVLGDIINAQRDDAGGSVRASVAVSRIWTNIGVNQRLAVDFRREGYNVVASWKAGEFVVTILVGDSCVAIGQSDRNTCDRHVACIVLVIVIVVHEDSTAQNRARWVFDTRVDIFNTLAFAQRHSWRCAIRCCVTVDCVVATNIGVNQHFAVNFCRECNGVVASWKASELVVTILVSDSCVAIGQRDSHTCDTHITGIVDRVVVVVHEDTASKRGVFRIRDYNNLSTGIVIWCVFTANDRDALDDAFSHIANGVAVACIITNIGIDQLLAVQHAVRIRELHAVIAWKQIVEGVVPVGICRRCGARRVAIGIQQHDQNTFNRRLVTIVVVDAVVIRVHEEATRQGAQIFQTIVNIRDRITDVHCDWLCAAACDLTNAGHNVTVYGIVAADICVDIYFTSEQRAKLDNIITSFEVFEDVVTICVSVGPSDNCVRCCITQIDANTCNAHIAGIVDGVVVVVHEDTTSQ